MLLARRANFIKYHKFFVPSSSFQKSTYATVKKLDEEPPLVWKRTFLEDGTAHFRHPSYEEVMSVKQMRYVREHMLQANPKRIRIHQKNYLTPEEIEEVKKLREKDPFRYTSKVLAKMFNVRPEFILTVAKDPKVKVLHDLRKLKEYNRNRPKRGSRQYLNKY